MEGADQRQSSKRNIAGYASIASTCLLQLPGRMVLTNTISPPWPCRPLRPSRQSPARMTPTVRCSWRQREQTDQALLAPLTFASHGQRRKLPSKPSGRGRNFRPRAHAASPSMRAKGGPRSHPCVAGRCGVRAACVRHVGNANGPSVGRGVAMLDAAGAEANA